MTLEMNQSQRLRALIIREIQAQANLSEPPGEVKQGDSAGSVGRSDSASAMGIFLEERVLAIIDEGVRFVRGFLPPRGTPIPFPNPQVTASGKPLGEPAKVKRSSRR
jgi:hypothetical protein